jgi:hypothetical protein
MSETTEAAAPEAGTAEDDLRDTPVAEPVDTQDDGDEPAAPTEAEPEEIEEIELSFGAEKLKVAKSALPADVLEKLDSFTKNVQGDYTRKTQEVAEQRKAAEAQMELANKLGSLKGEALTAFSAGQRIAQEIQQLEAVRLDELWQSDPDQARRISDALVSRRSEFQRQVNTVAQHEAAYDAEQQQFVAKQLDAGRARMSALVKGFDAAAEADLIQYAVKGGISEKDAKNWPLNPTTAAMVWKAMQFDRLQASTKAAVAAKPAQTPLAPVRAVAGKPSAPTKTPDQMSDEEYYRYEMAKHAKARR